MKQPIVSVLLPAYNVQKYIFTSVKSILNQSYRDFELIVIDDASTDSTGLQIKRFEDARLRYVRNNKREGIAQSLNYGLKIARGKYVARMDADDIAESERLLLQVTLLESRPQLTLVGSWASLIDTEGKTLGVLRTPLGSRQIKSLLQRQNPFIHPTVMFRREIIDKYGGYSQKLEGAEDYDLWLRIAPNSVFANIPRLLHQYRVHAESVSKKHTNRLNLAYAKVQIKKITDYGYPLWQSIYVIRAVISLLFPRIMKGLITRSEA